jgi:hypothetical protein
VVKIRSLVVCEESGLYWDPVVEPARCISEDHQHRIITVHVHLDLVVLPDGTTVTAASFDPEDPYSRDEWPRFGLYLDSKWQPPWDHAHLVWPDFGIPTDRRSVRVHLIDLHDRARSGEQVELGCLGGHGRTGTALAYLAVLSGLPAADAVAWVRANYCSEAIETPDQETFVAVLDR